MEGAQKISRDVDEPPFALFEYLPPGFGFSIKGVYLSYDGRLRSVSTYLLMSRPVHVEYNEVKKEVKSQSEVEDRLKVIFFNTPYFFAIFMTIAATVVIWKNPVSDQTGSPKSN